MLTAALKTGSIAAWRQKPLWILLWTWNLALTLPVALNAFLWWNNVLATRPASDALLDGFSFSVLREIAQYDRSPVWSRILSASFFAALLALLASPLVSAGMIEVLLSRENRRPLLRRFFRGAGRFYGRYFRLLLLFLAALALSAAVWFGLTSPLVTALGDSEWEPAPVVLRMAQSGIFLLVAAWLMVSMDYARIRLAAQDSRSARNAWLPSLAFVLQRPLLALGPWLAGGFLLLLLGSLYGGLAGPLTGRMWIWTAAMVLLQQVFVIMRGALRTAVVGSEIEIFRATAPPPPAREEPVLPSPLEEVQI